MTNVIAVSLSHRAPRPAENQPDVSFRESGAGGYGVDLEFIAVAHYQNHAVALGKMKSNQTVHLVIEFSLRLAVGLKGTNVAVIDGFRVVPRSQAVYAGFSLPS